MSAFAGTRLSSEIEVCAREGGHSASAPPSGDFNRWFLYATSVPTVYPSGLIFLRQVFDQADAPVFAEEGVALFVGSVRMSQWGG